MRFEHLRSLQCIHSSRHWSWKIWFFATWRGASTNQRNSAKWRSGAFSDVTVSSMIPTNLRQMDNWVPVVSVLTEDEFCFCAYFSFCFCHTELAFMITLLYLFSLFFGNLHIFLVFIENLVVFLHSSRIHRQQFSKLSCHYCPRSLPTKWKWVFYTPNCPCLPTEATLKIKAITHDQ